MDGIRKAYRWRKMENGIKQILIFCKCRIQGLELERAACIQACSSAKCQQ